MFILFYLAHSNARFFILIFFFTVTLTLPCFVSREQKKKLAQTQRRLLALQKRQKVCKQLPSKVAVYVQLVFLA